MKTLPSRSPRCAAIASLGTAAVLAADNITKRTRDPVGRCDRGGSGSLKSDLTRVRNPAAPVRSDGDRRPQHPARAHREPVAKYGDSVLGTSRITGLMLLESKRLPALGNWNVAAKNRRDRDYLFSLAVDRDRVDRLSTLTTHTVDRRGLDLTLRIQYGPR